MPPAEPTSKQEPRGLPPGFTVPDFTAPIDIDGLAAAASTVTTSKGMFLQGIVDRCAHNGTTVPFGPYVSFKDYPTGEHIRLLGAAARVLYPGLPTREGLRRIGQTSYDALTSTFIGKVVFGILGKDIRKITRLMPKAYEIAGRGVTASILEDGDTFSHVVLRGNVALATCYHCGAFEGVLAFCAVSGVVSCKIVSSDEVEMFTTWQDRGEKQP